MDEQNDAPQMEQPQEGGQPSQEGAQAPSQNARNMAMLCHLLGLFTAFLGPLILWLLKKDEDAFIDRQGKEALNFQITVMIASAIGGITAFLCIGFILLAIVGIGDLILCIMACMATSKGEDYRYPVALRLIK